MTASEVMHALRTLTAASALCLLATQATILHAAGAGGEQPIPDFTQGGKTDGSHDWTLGPTGARGWIYAWKNTYHARQILVTSVEPGSPAEGVLAADDVILGIGEKPFDGDARRQCERLVV